MRVSRFLLRQLEAKPSSLRIQQRALASGCRSTIHPTLVAAQPFSFGTTASEQHYSISSNSQAPINVRSFHTTAPALREVRRRRRRASSPIVDDEGLEEDAPDYQDYRPVTEIEEFRRHAKEALNKLAVSIEPMKAINDPFKVDLSDDIMTIELDPANGSFLVEIDEENRWLTIQSPVSGVQSYFFSQRKEEWVGAQDFHSMEGLFVRDLIRLCNGVPKL